ncbi:hypothetical protein NQK81_27840 [Amycolatopsis roodepoortensis]|uniref:hypothetical protein n=1 Tax=Amycolatopsis roodepoortensis TaxID=700274 RepID=UPI00214C6C7C|nr:hypothetical protein [Amycolatopsis roodepoortensis]UUV28589.1 hypothetical protein NQK81_27840 [Amycolatopsis roodepoortensis]
MSPDTAPADSAATEAGEPRGAAEHCAAAEALFARARAMYPSLSSRAYHQDEYRRCLDWAHLHLRLAEAITSGAGLVLAHRRLLANPDVRLHDTYVSAETQEWNEYFENQHNATRRSA